MPLDRDVLGRELNALRKGPAVRHHALLRRLGPQARVLFGIDEADSLVTARRKIAEGTAAMVEKLSPDLQMAVLAGLGLLRDTDHRLLRDRTVWLAQQLQCDERTARRRINDAFEQLLDVVTEQEHFDVSGPRVAPGPSVSWYTQSLRAILRLDSVSPDLSEHRTIVIMENGVQELSCLFSLPPADSNSPSRELEIEVTHGGRLGHRERLSESDFRFVVELPARYDKGARCEYGVHFRIPPGQPMRPHFVNQPLAPCELFDVTVRFPADARPAAVWLLDAVPVRAIDDERPSACQIQVDTVGEVRHQFHNLRPGLAYGLKWAAPAFRD